MQRVAPGNSSLSIRGLTEAPSGIRPTYIITHETWFTIYWSHDETVSPDGAACRIKHDCTSPALTAFLDIFMPQEDWGRPSSYKVLVGCQRCLQAVCKVLMHSEAERCSAANHTGHFFRLLTASLIPSKMFLCRFKNTFPQSFQLKASALNWNIRPVVCYYFLIVTNFTDKHEWASCGQRSSQHLRSHSGCCLAQLLSSAP